MLLSFSHVLQVYIIGDYEKVYFIAPECHYMYYGKLPKTKLLSKRGICLEKVPEKISKVDKILIANGWKCFSFISVEENM